MKNVALFGAVGLSAVALFVILSSSVSSDGGKVKLGVPSAEACTSTEPTKCLPHIDYLDKAGTAWTHDALAGKVVMVNFWATWCAPCKAEIPALTAAYEHHGDEGFVLLGVMMDSDTVDDEALAEFNKATGLDYPVVPIDADIWTAFDAPDALPTTFIYDRAGTLRLHHRGPLSEPDLEAVLAELMAESAPQ